MSYGLSAYLIEEDDAFIFGCQDNELYEDLLVAMSDGFDEYDKMLDLHEEDSISHRKALGEVIEGEISRSDRGGVYGWAYELYCSSVGKRLNSDPFVPCRISWYEQLDEYMQMHSIPLQFEDLISDCPIPIPQPDDWPCIGHWSPSAIRNASDAIEKFKLLDTDQEVTTAIEFVRQWFKLAIQDPALMIVGFHG